MSADATVFMELRFWVLVLFSVVLPAAIFVTLFVRREFSKRTVLVFGLLLIVLAGVDIFLLHVLSVAARATPSLADDVAFSSALSIALYILPAAFGTLGINMVSHVLMHYLRQKEERFEAHRAAPLLLAAVHLHPKTQAGSRRRMAQGVYRAKEARPGAPRQALRREWFLVDVRRRRSTPRLTPADGPRGPARADTPRTRFARIANPGLVGLPGLVPRLGRSSAPLPTAPPAAG